MIDMTQGKPIKLIAKFTLPLLLGNILQQAYNLVDSIVVGNFVGAEALASVSNSFIIMFLLTSLFTGIGMGGTILISQYLGAQQKENIKHTVDTLYITLLIGGIILTIIGVLGAPLFITLLNTPEGPITEMSTLYLRTIFAGVIANFGYSVNNAILQGIGDGKSSLIFLGIATIINIVLDILFVAIFDMGVFGVGLATILAQTISFIFGIWYINRKVSVLSIQFTNMKFVPEILRKSLKIGLPSALQNMLVSFGIMLIQRLVNSYGATFMAGYSAGAKIDSIVFLPIVSFSAAITTYVGQNIGARKLDRVKSGLKATMILSVSLSLILSFISIVFGKYILRIFVSDPLVIQAGQEYINRIMMGFPFLAALFVFSSLIRGAGQTMIPLIITIFSMGGRVVSAHIYAHFFGQYDMLWCFATDWIIGVILLGLYYASGRWKKNILQFVEEKNHITEDTES